MKPFWHCTSMIANCIVCSDFSVSGCYCFHDLANQTWKLILRSGCLTQLPQEIRLLFRSHIILSEKVLCKYHGHSPFLSSLPSSCSLILASNFYKDVCYMYEYVEMEIIIVKEWKEKCLPRTQLLLLRIDFSFLVVWLALTPLDVLIWTLTSSHENHETNIQAPPVLYHIRRTSCFHT